MSEEADTLKRVASLLEAAGIAYMLTGSMASALYGQPRMTRDVDLVIEISETNVAKIEALFSRDFLLNPEEIRRAVRDRGIFNIIEIDSVVKVDFIVRKDTPYRREEFHRRRREPIEGQLVSVVAPEDLVLSKFALGA